MADMSEMSEAASVHSDDEYSYSESSNQNDSEGPGNLTIGESVQNTKMKDGKNSENNNLQTSIGGKQKDHEGYQNGNITKFSRGKEKTIKKGQQPLNLSKHQLPTIYDNCPICDRQMDIIAFGSCRHYVCYVCGLKYRDLYKNTKCIICHVEIEKLVISYLNETENPLIKHFTVPCYMTNIKLVGPIKELYNPHCEECGRSFKDKYQLMHHTEKEHKKYYCEVCVNSNTQFLSEMPTYSKKGLMEHVKSQHTQCSMCFKQFYDIKSFYKHLDEDHFECLPCSNLSNDRIFFSTFKILRNHCLKDHNVCFHNECFSESDDGQLVAFAFPRQLADHLEQCHPGYATSEELKQLRHQTIDIDLFSSLDNRKEKCREFCIVRRDPGNEAFISQAKAISDQFRLENKDKLEKIEALKSHSTSEGKEVENNNNYNLDKSDKKSKNLSGKETGSNEKDRRKKNFKAIPIKLEDYIDDTNRGFRGSNVRYNTNIWGKDHSIKTLKDEKDEDVLDEGPVKSHIWVGHERAKRLASSDNLEDGLPVLDEGKRVPKKINQTSISGYYANLEKYNKYKKTMELYKPPRRQQPNPSNKQKVSEKEPANNSEKYPENSTSDYHNYAEPEGFINVQENKRKNGKYSLQDLPALEEKFIVKNNSTVREIPGGNNRQLRSYVKNNNNNNTSDTKLNSNILDELGCVVKVVKQKNKNVKNNDPKQHEKPKISSNPSAIQSGRRKGWGISSKQQNSSSKSEMPTLNEGTRKQGARNVPAAQAKPSVAYRDIDKVRKKNNPEDDMNDFFTIVRKKTEQNARKARQKK